MLIYDYWYQLHNIAVLILWWICHAIYIICVIWYEIYVGVYHWLECLET